MVSTLNLKPKYGGFSIRKIRIKPKLPEPKTDLSVFHYLVIGYNFATIIMSRANFNHETPHHNIALLAYSTAILVSNISFVIRLKPNSKENTALTYLHYLAELPELVGLKYLPIILNLLKNPRSFANMENKHYLNLNLSPTLIDLVFIIQYFLVLITIIPTLHPNDN